MSHRLGGGESDAEEVKSHMFFQSINWDDVYHKRIPPPFDPVITSLASTDYFDKELTYQNPQPTPPPSESASLSSSSSSSHLFSPFLSGPLQNYGDVFKDFDSVAGDW